MNGFGPIKSEWSINFVNSGYNDGWITFANEEYGLNFPIYIGNRKKVNKTLLETYPLYELLSLNTLKENPYLNKPLLQLTACGIIWNYHKILML